MIALDSRHGAVLKAARELDRPSCRAIAERSGVGSVTLVHRLLHELQDAGLVRLSGHRGSGFGVGQVTGRPILPAVLEEMDDAALRLTAAHIAGILAQREGAHETAEVFHRIADRLPGVRGKAA